MHRRNARHSAEPVVPHRGYERAVGTQGHERARLRHRLHSTGSFEEGRCAMMSVMGVGRVEITDLLWAVDPGGRRSPVRRDGVVARLVASGQRKAARIVLRMPEVDGVLDSQHVDALGLRVHRELQRLGEELQFGRRVAASLVPIVARLRAAGGTVRVIDVGCGLGYVPRWLAATSALGPDVELVGVDRNPVLVAEATRLAQIEGLSCLFVQGDAFQPDLGVEDGARTIVISSGLLHHLPESELADFFAAQGRLGVAAFAHWDIAPCRWTTLGAWVFHRARMREAVSRHDGVLSARRAHPAATLLTAAERGAPGYGVRVEEGSRWHPRAIDVVRPVVGQRCR
jgi:SAM-dependent methyltransferase